MASVVAPYQFTLKRLFAAMSLIAVYTAAGSYVGFVPVVGAIIVLGLAFVVPTAATKRQFVVTVVLVQALFLLCGSMYYTDGLLLALAAWLAVFSWGVVVTAYLSSPRFALACLLVVFIPFAVRQVVLLERLVALQREVTGIAGYIDEYQEVRGFRPPNIAEHEFRRPSLRRSVSYFPGVPGETDWVIVYELHDWDNARREYGLGRGWYYRPM